MAYNKERRLTWKHFYDFIWTCGVCVCVCVFFFSFRCWAAAAAGGSQLTLAASDADPTS